MREYKRTELTKVDEVQNLEFNDGEVTASHITAITGLDVDLSDGRYLLDPTVKNENIVLVIYEVDEDAENIFDIPEEADR